MRQCGRCPAVLLTLPSPSMDMSFDIWGDPDEPASPVVLSVPAGVDVRKVDLALELQILSFHEHRKGRRTPGVTA